MVGRILMLATLVAAAVAALAGGTAKGTSPGANGKLAFVKDVGGTGDIWIANADGSNPTQLTTDPAVDRSPRWSPDGMRIAFASNRDGDFEIFVMNADASDQRQLTFNSGAQDRFPAWAADGTLIAYDKNFSEIYAINADGTGGERKLADGQVPGTSTHGQKVVFSDNSFSVFTMKLDGSARHQIMDGAVVGGFNADWAPRGNNLVIAAEFATAPPDNDVFRIRANGKGLVQLTNTDNRIEFSPVWSRDGTKIAFSGCVASGCEIFVMNADGSGETQVTTFGIGPGTGGVDWQT